MKHEIVMEETRKDKSVWVYYEDGLKLPKGIKRIWVYNLFWFIMKIFKPRLVAGRQFYTQASLHCDKSEEN